MDYPFFKRLEQHQKLPDRDRQSTLFELEKELDQHDLNVKIVTESYNSAWILRRVIGS
jgi:hypothetical protein